MKSVVSGLTVALVLVCLGDVERLKPLADQGDSGRCVVERMPVPKAGVRSAAECGDAVGPAKVWDFTKGSLPSGCRLRSDGTLSEKGVGSRDFASVSSQGGCVIADGSTPQGAFLFEAEVEVGDYAPESKKAHSGRIWDDFGISYSSPKRDNTGLEIGLRQEPNGYWTARLRSSPFSSARTGASSSTSRG